MNKKIILPLFAACLILTACGANTSESSTSSTSATTRAVTAAPESLSETAAATTAPAETTEKITVAPEAVGYDGMEPVSGSAIKDGEYHITVDSSSSMFKIADCVLKVNNGELTADIIIASKSYDYLFPGTGEQAEAADALNYISYTEDSEGRSVFVFPVEALDKEVQCAAFSAKKKSWYDRTLVFRADSLPDDAFDESRYTDAASLGLADGEYTVEVTLEGGSGKASVQSSAALTIKDGSATAKIVWSSNKYDYMIVDGEKILPVSTEEFSEFEIPVKGFDCKMPVSADTTAMSQPYEIEYTLYFDSSTIK